MIQKLLFSLGFSLALSNSLLYAAADDASEKGKNAHLTPSQKFAPLKQKYGLDKEIPPAGDYIPFASVSLVPGQHLIFTSGMGSIYTEHGKPVPISGETPTTITKERACEAAAICVLRHLASFERAGFNLDEIIPIELTCFIHAPHGYGDLPDVTNAASKVIFEIFRKRIARTTVSGGTPKNYTVEIRGTYAYGNVLSISAPATSSPSALPPSPTVPCALAASAASHGQPTATTQRRPPAIFSHFLPPKASKL